jgi:hypothetical protein
MINRRRFLWGSAGFVVVAGVTVGLLARPVIESEIEAVVRRRLSYLKLDAAGVRRFASDQTTKILAKRVSFSRMRYHLASSFGSSYKRFARSTDTRSRTQRIEDMWVCDYLLSSDFFINGSNETRVIQYVSYYDPLLRPCGNPFARPAVG